MASAHVDHDKVSRFLTQKEAKETKNYADLTLNVQSWAKRVGLPSGAFALDDYSSDAVSVHGGHLRIR